MYRITLSNDEKIVVGIDSENMKTILNQIGTIQGNAMLSIMNGETLQYAFRPNDIYSIIEINTNEEQIKQEDTRKILHS